MTFNYIIKSTIINNNTNILINVNKQMNVNKQINVCHILLKCPFYMLTRERN